MMEVWWWRWWKKKADRFQGCWRDRICRTWWLIRYVVDDVKRMCQRWLLGIWFRKQDEWGMLFFETRNRKEGTVSGKMPWPYWVSVTWTGDAYMKWAGVTWILRGVRNSESEVTQLCPTLCNPMDCSIPGSSVHGILQARVLEWVAISFSRGSSQPRDWTRVFHI